MNHTRLPLPDLFGPIVAALENSGRLTDAILAFVDTALFTPQPDALQAFLTEPDCQSERDSLLDLIFSPDLAVQTALEPLIEAAGCTAADAAALHDRLLASPIHACIEMPDGRRLTRIPVPDDIKSRYLERLNVAWRLDPQVRAAIDRGVAEKKATAVKVRLRNGGVCPTADQRTVLCRYFERMADDDPDYLACLDLFLYLTGGPVKVDAVYEHLAAHKRFLFRSLRQAQRFEALLRRSNMETLMLQGFRAPHVSRDELTRQMRHVDLICVSMFGKTEVIVPPVEDPVQTVTDLESPAAAVRSLLR